MIKICVCGHDLRDHSISSTRFPDIKSCGSTRSLLKKYIPDVETGVEYNVCYCLNYHEYAFKDYIEEILEDDEKG